MRHAWHQMQRIPAACTLLCLSTPRVHAWAVRGLLLGCRTEKGASCSMDTCAIRKHLRGGAALSASAQTVDCLQRACRASVGGRSTIHVTEVSRLSAACVLQSATHPRTSGGIKAAWNRLITMMPCREA